jgi:predicted negative regulator of RcsB-dependent stress response
MDEEIEIINRNTRNQKIKNFFNNYKKQLIIIVFSIVLAIFGYFIYENLKKNNKIKLANQYNLVTVDFSAGNKLNIKKKLIEIINKKDKTYSPLALYFIIDNNINLEKNEINKLFDIIISEIDLEKEIKNLIIYKKALYNSDFESENNLLQILSPVIKSDSIWKSHGLYLMAEFFYFKNEKQKAKDFFDQIISLENSNTKIKLEAQKRLNRDFSE